MELEPNEVSDEDLVAASRNGDREAYSVLVRRYSKRVYAVCLGILGRVADSEDILQETFVKGMVSLQTLRSGSQFGGWISQIARNLCRDHLRNRHRKRRSTAEVSGLPASAPSAYKDLYLALGKLPEEHRLALMLFYFDGKSTQKLAQELRLTRAGACTRLFRARNELRRILGK